LIREKILQTLKAFLHGNDALTNCDGSRGTVLRSESFNVDVEAGGHTLSSLIGLNKIRTVVLSKGAAIRLQCGSVPADGTESPSQAHCRMNCTKDSSPNAPSDSVASNGKLGSTCGLGGSTSAAEASIASGHDHTTMRTRLEMYPRGYMARPQQQLWRSCEAMQNVWRVLDHRGCGACFETCFETRVGRQIDVVTLCRGCQQHHSNVSHSARAMQGSCLRSSVLRTRRCCCENLSPSCREFTSQGSKHFSCICFITFADVWSTVLVLLHRKTTREQICHSQLCLEHGTGAAWH
jgi:hypothetical protein